MLKVILKLWLTKPWVLPLIFALPVAVWTLFFGSPLETWDLWWFDQAVRARFWLGLAPSVDSRIVHLGIGHQDMREMRSTKMEYDTIARIIQKCSDLGAKVVAFDAIFTRGSTLEAPPILEAIRKASEEGCTVVLAEGNLLKNGFERLRSFPWRDERHVPSGLINVTPDHDGVFRRYLLASRTPQGTEPSLALAIYLTWRGSLETFLPAGLDEVQWLEIPEDEVQSKLRRVKIEPVLLNFRAGWGENRLNHPAQFTYWSLERLFSKPSEQSHLSLLKGRIVLISYVTPALGDFGNTPLGSVQPLAAMHLTALNDLIQNSFCTQAPHWMSSLFLLGVGGLSLGICRFRQKRLLFVVASLGLVALWAIGWLCIWKFRVVFAGATAIGLWSILFVGEVSRLYAVEFWERLKLRTTMTSYFSPRVLEHVLAHPGSMVPQRAEITVLLTDLRNSTPLTEKIGAGGMFNLLNQVFEAQTQPVLREDGSMEHFIGDQFLAYWGAPDPQPDASDRALRAAISLIQNMDQVESSLAGEIREFFGYGMALHRGKGLIGNKGSRQRLDYGLVGDFVNAAARVESLTKYYGVLFLITEEVLKNLKTEISARLVDCVVVKGKTEPLRIYEVKHPLSRGDFEVLRERYGEAFTLYQQGDFRKALICFHQVAEEFHDTASRVLAENCEGLSANPPSHWNGVRVLTFK